MYHSIDMSNDLVYNKQWVYFINKVIYLSFIRHSIFYDKIYYPWNSTKFYYKVTQF